VDEFLGNLEMKRRTALQDPRPVLELLISTRLTQDYDGLLRALGEATNMGTVQQVRLQIVPGGDFVLTAEFLAAVFTRLNHKLVSFESGCSFPGADRRIATDALEKCCPYLKEVDIYERDELTIVSWIQAIQHSTTLQKIEVGSSEMGKICIDALSQLLRRSPSGNLKELIVVCFRKDVDLSPLAESLRCNVALSRLRIDLSFCNISPNSATANTKEVEAFSNVLQHDNYTLNSLEVRGIDPSHGKIAFYLKLNHVGRTLLLRSGLAKEKDWVDAIIRSRFNTSIVFYFLRKNPSLCALFEEDALPSPASARRPSKKAKT
jgi:hypothetical protein